MHGCKAFVALLLVACLPAIGRSTIITNAALPITHRVTVQMIQTTTTSGSASATLLGNATQQANIESRIDQIWAQAGIDIKFLPTVNVFANTFSYQGSSSPRPGTDLQAIINLATDADKINDDPLVLNVFFVEVVPFFSQLNEDTAAGYANIGGNGIAYTVGSNLFSTQNRRDVIASVLSHEIGHNLGLDHVFDANNLMHSDSMVAQEQQRLTASQVEAALETTSYAQLLPVLLGDYNQNDEIDSADYTVWRDAMTAGSSTLPNDPTPGSVTASDFTYWRNNFGDVLGSGSGAGGDGLSGDGLNAVPEPASCVLLITALAALACYRQKRRR